MFKRGMTVFAALTLTLAVTLAAAPALAKGPIVVKGVIQNLDELRGAVDAKSYMQLIPVSKDGKLTVLFREGKVTLRSDQPTMKLPSSKAFAIKASKPGRYMLAVQHLTMPKQRVALAAEPKGKSLIIGIPGGDRTPSDMDIGEIVFPLKKKAK